MATNPVRIKKKTLSVDKSHFLILYRSRFALNVNLLYKLCPSLKMFCCGSAVGLDPCLILQLWEQSLLSTQRQADRRLDPFISFVRVNVSFLLWCGNDLKGGGGIGTSHGCRDLPGKSTLPKEKELYSIVSAQRLEQSDEWLYGWKGALHFVEITLSLCSKKITCHWLGNKELSSAKESILVF